MVAMVVGRLITDHVPLGQAADRPFVSNGQVGETVRLSYADVTVTAVRGAARISGDGGAVAPGGHFLVVDVRLLARQEPTQFRSVYLIDTEGRRFVPTGRGGCTLLAHAPTGAPWYARYCFDVPHKALHEVHLVVGRGDFGVNGSGTRRDALAEVDLGLDTSRADAVWAATAAVPGYSGGLTAPDPSGPTE